MLVATALPEPGRERGNVVPGSPSGAVPAMSGATGVGRSPKSRAWWPPGGEDWRNRPDIGPFPPETAISDESPKPESRFCHEESALYGFYGRH